MLYRFAIVTIVFWLFAEEICARYRYGDDQISRFIFGSDDLNREIIIHASKFGLQLGFSFDQVWKMVFLDWQGVTKL